MCVIVIIAPNKGCMYALFVVCLPVGMIAVVALMMGSVLDREVHPNTNVAACELASNVANCTTTSDDDYYDRKIRVATAVSFICGLFLVSQFLFCIVCSYWDFCHTLCSSIS